MKCTCDNSAHGRRVGKGPTSDSLFFYILSSFLHFVIKGKEICEKKFCDFFYYRKFNHVKHTLLEKTINNEKMCTQNVYTKHF